MKKIDLLCILIVFLTLITTLVGILYSTSGSSFTVENIYGETIELYGSGIYKYDSVIKASGNKGTDFVMMFVGLCLLFFTLLKKKFTWSKYLQGGTLSGLLYYSSCLVFGVSFNRLFPIYIVLFSSYIFATVFFISDLFKDNPVNKEVIGRKFTGTSLFLLICGSSGLVWLEFILPSIATGAPLSIIDIYTTEITFVLDLAIILPVFWYCGISLLMKKEIGYKLTPILLTFIVIVGLTVIGQNIVQSSLGIALPTRQLFGLVISFVLLGIVAVILNIRFLKLVTQKSL